MPVSYTRTSCEWSQHLGHESAGSSDRIRGIVCEAAQQCRTIEKEAIDELWDTVNGTRTGEVSEAVGISVLCPTSQIHLDRSDIRRQSRRLEKAVGYGNAFAETQAHSAILFCTFSNLLLLAIRLKFIRQDAIFKVFLSDTSITFCRLN